MHSSSREWKRRSVNVSKDSGCVIQFVKFTETLSTPPLSRVIPAPRCLSNLPLERVITAGTLSADVLTMGGVSTAVTFGEATEANLQGCAEVDGVMGMGLTNEDESNAFEDMVEVRRPDSRFSLMFGVGLRHGCSNQANAFEDITAGAGCGVGNALFRNTVSYAPYVVLYFSSFYLLSLSLCLSLCVSLSFSLVPRFSFCLWRERPEPWRCRFFRSSWETSTPTRPTAC